jgi:hypothetical protein
MFTTASEIAFAIITTSETAFPTTNKYTVSNFVHFDTKRTSYMISLHCRHSYAIPSHAVEGQCKFLRIAE